VDQPVSFITNNHIEVTKQFKLYLSFTRQEQLVLRAMAVCSEVIGQTVFRKILASFSGDSTFEKVCSTTKLDMVFSSSFRDLLEKYKLVSVNHKGVVLSKYLMHALTMQCLQDGTLREIIKQIENISPAKKEYSWGSPHFNYSIRHFKNNLYLGDFDKLEGDISFNKNPQTLDLDNNHFLLTVCFYPFSEAFFLNLPQSIQYQAFALLFLQQQLAQEDTNEALALLTGIIEKGLCDYDLQLLLAEQLLLEGQLSQVEKILLPLNDKLQSKNKSDIRYFPYLQALMGWLSFLQEDFTTALNYFEQHKLSKNKLTRRKRQYVGGVAGIFYMFTLLKLGNEKNKHYFTLATEQYFNFTIDKTNPQHNSSSHRTLSSFVEVLIGKEESMHRVHTTFRYSEDIFEFNFNLLLSALGHTWLGIAIHDEYLVTLDQHFAAWQRSNNGLFANVCAQLLVKHSAGSRILSVEKQAFYQEFLTKQAAQAVAVNLLGLIVPKEKWLTALEQLISLDDDQKMIAEDPLMSDSHKRLIWLVDTQGQRKVEVREQKRNKDSWSKGRPVALQRLSESPEEFPYLTPADKKICQAIDIYYDSYHWHQKKTFDLYGYEALKACVGHPLLFIDNLQRTPLEIIERVPELVISESGRGYKISLADIPNYVEFDEDFYNLRSETASRYILTAFKNKHVEIAKIVGHKGLTIPASAKDKVIQSIKAIAPLLNIQTNISGIEGIDTGIEQVELDHTLYINIEPSGDGLQFECHVQPLGEQGPRLLPGIGNDMVVAQVDDKRVGTTRLIKQEQKHFKALVDACPMFNYMSEHLLVLDDLEDALGCLEHLEVLTHDVLLNELAAKSLDEGEHLGKDKKKTQANSKKSTTAPLKIALQWPEGKALKVSKTLSSKQMNVKVGKKQDWFDLDGELTIDENEVIDLKKLITLVSSAKGRFIQLSDDRFIALTEGLKKQLTLLDKVSSNGKFDALASPVIDEALAGMQVKSGKAWQQQMKKLAQSYKLQPKVPETLQAQLRDYQLAGYDWASRLSHWGAGACLADDMGLGKTLQALAIIVERASKGPTLVLAPTSVSFNWQDEAAKFSPTLRVKLYGMYRQEQRDQLLENAQAFDLIICSYGLLQTQGEKLAKVHWQTLIADEAQALKNPQTKRSKIANTLTADFKMITTGTPIENNLTELWSLFRFINPGLLGSLQQFNKRFVQPIENANSGKENKEANKEANKKGINEANEVLRKIIAPFMLRRLKTDVLTELPSRTEINIHVELSQEESALYEAIRQKAIENLMATDEKAGQKRIKILAEIMRLRRACCHPKLVFAESDVAGSKLKVFDNLVTELKQGGHKALVFSQFVGHLAILKQHLKDRGISFQYLDGSTSLAKRKKAVTDFQAGVGDLFLISLKAGGSGLNLTAADYVIHMDPWWNPAVEDQASDRAHRMGQTRPVTIYRLITQHTIEDKIVALHQQKRDLANSLLEGTDTAKAISLDDMMNLLKNE
jgi:SNF2 family DNA or RNA helicase